MTLFDPDRSEIKFDSMIIFLTHSAVSHQKRIFRLKSKIWIGVIFDQNWYSLNTEKVFEFLISYDFPFPRLQNKGPPL